AASLVSDAAHADANIIFGAVIDDALGDEVRVTVIAAGFDSGRPSTRKDAGSSLATAPPAAPPAGLNPYRRPMAPGVPQVTGERLAAPATPAAPVGADAPAQGRTASGSGSNGGSNGAHGGGITVPPLPPIPGPVSGRRPLSNEDFEEELDIPEFLKG
ncbi:MAG: ftsZ, partial [Blastococcus sp.]|nr:ftsZ [Blastococcus sp.]MCW2683649.1 ftsZ [Blastococcus sp.]